MCVCVCVCVHVSHSLNPSPVTTSYLVIGSVSSVTSVRSALLSPAGLRVLRAWYAAAKTCGYTHTHAHTHIYIHICLRCRSMSTTLSTINDTWQAGSSRIECHTMPRASVPHHVAVFSCLATGQHVARVRCVLDRRMRYRATRTRCVSYTPHAVLHTCRVPHTGHSVLTWFTLAIILGCTLLVKFIRDTYISMASTAGIPGCVHTHTDIRTHKHTGIRGATLVSCVYLELRTVGMLLWLAGSACPLASDVCVCVQPSPVLLSRVRSRP